MIDSVVISDRKAIVTYDFTKDELDILKHLKKHGYMEFKDGINSIRVDKLIDYGFVTESYNVAYSVILTRLGESVAEKL